MDALLNLLIDLAKELPGLIAFLVVLVNIFKHFGWVKNGETFAASLQLIVSVFLTIVGFFFPHLFDWFPYIDKISQALAELGALVIPVYVAVIKVANLIHDMLTKVTFFGINKALAKQLTP